MGLFSDLAAVSLTAGLAMSNRTEDERNAKGMDFFTFLDPTYKTKFNISRVDASIIDGISFQTKSSPKRKSEGKMCVFDKTRQSPSDGVALAGHADASPGCDPKFPYELTGIGEDSDVVAKETKNFKYFGGDLRTGPIQDDRNDYVYKCVSQKNDDVLPGKMRNWRKYFSNWEYAKYFNISGKTDNIGKYFYGYDKTTMCDQQLMGLVYLHDEDRRKDPFYTYAVSKEVRDLLFQSPYSGNWGTGTFVSSVMQSHSEKKFGATRASDAASDDPWGINTAQTCFEACDGFCEPVQKVNVQCSTWTRSKLLRDHCQMTGNITNPQCLTALTVTEDAVLTHLHDTPGKTDEANFPYTDPHYTKDDPQRFPHYRTDGKCGLGFRYENDAGTPWCEIMGEGWRAADEDSKTECDGTYVTQGCQKDEKYFKVKHDFEPAAMKCVPETSAAQCELLARGLMGYTFESTHASNGMCVVDEQKKSVSIKYKINDNDRVVCRRIATQHPKMIAHGLSCLGNTKIQSEGDMSLEDCEEDAFFNGKPFFSYNSTTSKCAIADQLGGMHDRRQRQHVQTSGGGRTRHKFGAQKLCLYRNAEILPGNVQGDVHVAECDDTRKTEATSCAPSTAWSTAGLP